MENLLEISLNIENGKIIEDEQFLRFKKETRDVFHKKTIYWFHDVSEKELSGLSFLRRYKVELGNEILYFVVCHLRGLEDIATKELFSVFEKDDTRLSFVLWVTNDVDGSNIKFRLDTIINNFSKIKNINLTSFQTINITGLKFMSSFLKGMGISARFGYPHSKRNGRDIPFVPPESRGHFKF